MGIVNLQIHSIGLFLITLKMFVMFGISPYKGIEIKIHAWTSEKKNSFYHHSPHTPVFIWTKIPGGWVQHEKIFFFAFRVLTLTLSITYKIYY